MEKLAGYVEHIIYRNTDNGYTVLNLVSGEDEITVSAFFRRSQKGKILRRLAIIPIIRRMAHNLKW